MLSKIYKRQTTIKQLLSHATYVATISRSNSSSYVASQDKLLTNYDAIIVGAGHNGLVAAAYLQKNGLKVCVLERRHLIGGAAVTEELIPGFKFSRASYLLSLLRPQVMDELELKKHGLKLYFREPNSYTPLHESYWREGKPRSLTMGNDKEFTSQQIGRFSEKDAVAFFEYEHTLNAIIDVMGPVLDTEPVDIKTWETKGLAALKIIRDNWQAVKTITQSSLKLGKYTIPFYELMTAPASKILNRWFESEPLKAALATDSVIGAMLSPHSPGSGSGCCV